MPDSFEATDTSPRNSDGDVAVEDRPQALDSTNLTDDNHHSWAERTSTVEGNVVTLEDGSGPSMKPASQLEIELDVFEGKTAQEVAWISELGAALYGYFAALRDQEMLDAGALDNPSQAESHPNTRFPVELMKREVQRLAQGEESIFQSEQQVIDYCQRLFDESYQREVDASPYDIVKMAAEQHPARQDIETYEAKVQSEREHLHLTLDLLAASGNERVQEKDPHGELESQMSITKRMAV